MKDRKKKTRIILLAALTLLLVFSMLSATVLAFPQTAARVIPGIPVLKDMAEMDEQLAELNEEAEKIREADQIKASEIETLKREIEELRIILKEISEETIREIETSPNEDEAQNLKIQSIVVNFVKEMYRGDYEKAAAYCTSEFAGTVRNDPGDVIMRPSSTVVVFTQITNVAKVNDSLFLVFLRLNDSGEEMEADYQLDFEVIKDGDDYLISFVGIDA